MAKTNLKEYDGISDSQRHIDDIHRIQRLARQVQEAWTHVVRQTLQHSQGQTDSGERPPLGRRNRIPSIQV